MGTLFSKYNSTEIYNIQLKVQSIIGKELQDTSQYIKMQTPKKGDWLYHIREYEQTFEKYVNDYQNVEKTRNTIYILPMFSDNDTINIGKIVKYIEIFFQMNVKLLQPTIVNQFKHREVDKQLQYDTRNIMDYLLKVLPLDAFCLLALTDVDLYCDGFNFLFGEASYYKHIGISSIARFDPSFYSNITDVEATLEAIKKLTGYDYKKIFSQDTLFNRTLKICTHEILHMFQFDHCVKYHCNMCGINDVRELDLYPHRLCVDCLSKLCYARIYECNDYFDVAKREKELLKFYGEENITDIFNKQ